METHEYDDLTVREAASFQLDEAALTTGTIDIIVPSTVILEVQLVEEPPPPTPTKDGRHHKYAPRPATSHIWYDEPINKPVVPRMTLFSRAQRISFMVASHIAVAVATFAGLSIAIYPQIA